ncbi:MAG: hypothetical protein MUO51_13190 [Woeseiaceae bacterium]|nr:hypothetical protein [Woeseiaceae bacterium]
MEFRIDGIRVEANPRGNIWDIIRGRPSNMLVLENAMSAASHPLRKHSALLVVLALTGCIGNTVPFGYERIQQSTQFVQEELLKRMVHDHWTRDAIVAALGKPDAENETTRVLGYERCVVSDAKEGFLLILPLPIWGSAGDITHCQLVKLWLDDNNQLVRWSDRIGVKEIPAEGLQSYNLECDLDGWLAGESCPDGRRWNVEDW